MCDRCRATHNVRIDRHKLRKLVPFSRVCLISARSRAADLTYAAPLGDVFLSRTQFGPKATVARTLWRHESHFWLPMRGLGSVGS